MGGEPLGGHAKFSLEARSGEVGVPRRGTHDTEITHRLPDRSGTDPERRLEVELKVEDEFRFEQLHTASPGKIAALRR